MKFFTAKWWFSQTLDWTPEHNRVFGAYVESLPPVLSRLPERLHWITVCTAIHDARNITLESDRFSNAVLRFDTDHDGVCGRVVMTFVNPTKILWESNEPIDLESVNPALTLGYHEFSVQGEKLGYNAIFDQHCELAIVFESLEVSIGPYGGEA